MKITTARFTSRVSHNASPITSLTGFSNSNDQPQSPCSRPEKPFGPGITPIHTRYCSQTGRSRPYCAMRNCALVAAAASPWARSSAI
jgi:hypothetical protein